MIKIEVDGPSGKNHIEVKGFGAQIVVETQIGLGLILLKLEEMGLPIDMAARVIGNNLDNIIGELRKADKKGEK